MNVIGLSTKKYQLDPKAMKAGGEGAVHHVLGAPSQVVAKLYNDKSLSRELEEKLVYMVDHPPVSAWILSQVAWPQDVVFHQNGEFCGFVMPKLKYDCDLDEVYRYPSKLSSRNKVIIGQNICAVVSEMHGAGYTIGDFNPRNIGVDTSTGYASFFDADSYHIVIDKAQNRAYRCTVCAPGYVAPELLEVCGTYLASHTDRLPYANAPLDTFTQDTDKFALAIHIFKLLMNGYTPFGGIKNTAIPSQASPGQGNEAVRLDNYCFKSGLMPQSAAILPLEAFPQEIGELFTRAFVGGKQNPKLRPSAKEWYDALVRYEKQLIDCKDNLLHQYDSRNGVCPLCEADERYKSRMSSAGGAQSTVIPPKHVPLPVSPGAQPPMPNPSSVSPALAKQLGIVQSPNVLNTPFTGSSSSNAAASNPYARPVSSAPSSPLQSQPSVPSGHSLPHRKTAQVAAQPVSQVSRGHSLRTTTSISTGASWTIASLFHGVVFLLWVLFFIFYKQLGEALAALGLVEISPVLGISLASIFMGCLVFALPTIVTFSLALLAIIFGMKRVSRNLFVICGNCTMIWRVLSVALIPIAFYLTVTYAALNGSSDFAATASFGDYVWQFVISLIFSVPNILLAWLCTRLVEA